MTTKDFLLEIGTEELPPKEIKTISFALATMMEKKLQDFSLSYKASKIFSSPRRVAILINGLVERQPDLPLSVKGPSVGVAFDQDGKPTVAAQKFAASVQAEISQLERVEEKKGEFLYYKTIKVGQNTPSLLADIVADIIPKLPAKRAMFWGAHNGPWVRPLRWLLAIFGDQIVKLEVFGIKSSNQSFGHRFFHPEAITINQPSLYEELLATKARVMVDQEKRSQVILEQISSISGYKPIMQDDLLNEITNLVEWPGIFVGAFDQRFLKIPPEMLTTTLKNHQKCFSLVDQDNNLATKFVIVTNAISKEPQNIIKGFERVINARLLDAEYFYLQDLKEPLINNLAKLKKVSFQEGLGSLYDKTLRMVELAKFIASNVDGDQYIVEQASKLAKCDLVTQAVGEFPELQGVMGYYYSLKDNSQEVANAIKEQYLPRFAKDDLPTSSAGIILAIADRVDTLVGSFILGKAPTGDKDPLGLRRAALGIIRIIQEKGLSLDLPFLLEKSSALYQHQHKNGSKAQAEILTFIYDRLQNIYLEEGKNISIFKAVLAKSPADLIDFKRRFVALDEFIALPEAGNLIETYKRIKNILEKGDNIPSPEINLSLLLEEEKMLVDIANSYQDEILVLYHKKEYCKLLNKLLLFKLPLENFFSQVMVMDENQNLRHNRLNILKMIFQLFGLIADLSFLISGSGAK